MHSHQKLIAPIKFSIPKWIEHNPF